MGKKQTVIKATAVTFTICNNHFQGRFTNRLKSSISTQTPVPVLLLLCEAIEYAALNGWTYGAMYSDPEQSLRHGDVAGGVSDLKDTLGHMGILSNLQAVFGVVAGIQTSLLTLPVGGPMAAIFNGESVGMAGIEQYLKYSNDEAVKRFIADMAANAKHI